MSANGVYLMPIANLMGKEFFIRSYQRGYRWEQDQVWDLLNDFNDFIEQPSKLEEEFYCLQPIVVKTLNQSEKQNISNKHHINFEKDNVYEVIDGQQRITTSIILIKVILESIKDKEWFAGDEYLDLVKKYIGKKNENGMHLYYFGYTADNPSYEFLKTKIFGEKST